MVPFIVLFIVTLTVPMFSATMIIQFQDVLMDACTTHRLQSPQIPYDVRGLYNMHQLLLFIFLKFSTAYYLKRMVLYGGH